MKELKEYQLKNVYGGAASAVLLRILGVIAGIVFGIGVVDGYVRPIKCR